MSGLSVIARREAGCATVSSTDGSTVSSTSTTTCYIDLYDVLSQVRRIVGTYDGPGTRTCCYLICCSACSCAMNLSGEGGRVAAWLCLGRATAFRESILHHQQTFSFDLSQPFVLRRVCRSQCLSPINYIIPIAFVSSILRRIQSIIMSSNNGSNGSNGGNGSNGSTTTTVPAPRVGTDRVKQGLAQMLKGGVIVRSFACFSLILF